MQLAETIYHLRIQKGMSQGDLAEALEVSRQSVSKWETGGATPDLDKLVKMSVLFGVTLDELVTGEKGQTETQPQPEPAPEPQVVYVERTREDGPKRKIVALVLFGLGILVILLCTILGSMLGGILYSLPFWVCGVICMVCRRRCGLWCAWALFFLLDMFLRFATGISWGGFRAIAQIFRYFSGVRGLVSLGMTALVAALVVWTVLSFREKVLEPCKKVAVKLIGLALVIAVCQTVPWLFSKLTERYVQSINGGQALLSFSRVFQVVGIVTQWGKLWAFCTALTDLLSLRRYRKKKI